MDEISVSMELRPNTIMCAFFSIQIRRGVKKFRLQAPWSQNWCLVPELVFDLFNGHPPHRSASPVELRLRVGPRVHSGQVYTTGPRFVVPRLP